MAIHRTIPVPTISASGNRLRGRLAPSPTGYLHLGNARSFLLAWLQMRSLGGEVILRIEDLDLARAVTGADEGIIRDLQWLGLDWDNELTPEYYQSKRFHLYREAISNFREQDLVYECYCSRKELRESLSAPHGSGEFRYPGTCRHLTESERAEKAERKEPAVRFKVEEGTVLEFEDLVAGPLRTDLYQETGDFIVARADGIPAYQLGVVLDDIAMGITHILRGDDLLSSTPRQLHLYSALGQPAPAYAHVPLICAPDGSRLSKRFGSISIEEIREAGTTPEEVTGWMAWSCGLRPTTAPCTASELVRGFSTELLSREVTILGENVPLKR